MEAKYNELRNRLAEIHDLNKIGWVLGWDQRTMMPAKGAKARAEQLASLGRVAGDIDHPASSTKMLRLFRFRRQRGARSAPIYARATRLCP